MVLQLVVPSGEHRGFIHRYHDSIFSGHFGVSRTVCRLLGRVYWPGLCEDVRSYLASYSVYLARKFERFNRMLLMMLAMFAGEHHDYWDYLLPAAMMACHSSVHESTGFSPYQLMFVEECTLPMDIGLPRRDRDSPDPIQNSYVLWIWYALQVAYDQVRCHTGQALRRPKRLYDKRPVKRVFAIGDWTMRYYPPG